MAEPSLVDVLTGIEHCWARGLLWRLDPEGSTRLYVAEHRSRVVVRNPGSKVRRAGR